MNDFDNFCIANNLAQDNGWSLGQQWGFAAFMNDCDKAAKARQMEAALTEQTRKTEAMAIELNEHIRKSEEIEKLLVAQNWEPPELVAAWEDETQKMIELITALRRENRRTIAMTEAKKGV